MVLRGDLRGLAPSVHYPVASEESPSMSAPLLVVPLVSAIKIQLLPTSGAPPAACDRSDRISGEPCALLSCEHRKGLVCVN